MKVFFYFVICILTITFACQSSKRLLDKKENKETKSLNPNNKIIINSNNSTFSGTSEDKIIFKGENNIIEINSDSSQFNSKNSRNVLVVEGNNNNFQFNQKGIIDLSENSNDTLILKGNEQQSIFNVTNSGTSVEAHVENIKNANSTVITFKDDQEFIKEEEDFDITVNSNELIYVPELETEISAGEALLYYQQEAKNGNLDAIFKLGSFYHYGIGCTRNIKKALEYYELAARKNHIEAQYLLGEIYEFGLKQITENKEKSIYYYTLAAKNGHPQAKLKVD
jgi:hypothetical protein